MNNINTLRITLLVLLVAAYACKKSSGPRNPNGGDKTCYVMETDLTQGGSTTRTVYTYNADHSVASIEVIDGNNPSSAFYKYSKPSANVLRIDFYVSTNGVLGKHSGYDTYALNAGNKADSMMHYGCVDCELDEPTQFELKSTMAFQYDAGGKLIHTANLHDWQNEYHTELQYDSKGRLSQYTDFDASDSLNIFIYTYAASDAENFSTGEPADNLKAIFGNSMVYQPVSITSQIVGTGVWNKVDYKNTGNADGYLVSSTVSQGGINGGKTTYTYDCVDK